MKFTALKTLVLSCVLSLPALAQTNSASPLADAIQSGKREQALSLLQGGADVNQPQADGTTALHWAVYRVDESLVDTLLSREADPNARNIFGTTPLAEAVKVANITMMRSLLNAGADVEAANDDGQTALMLAIDTGLYPLVELLVEHGADVNAREEWHYQTPLMWAAAGNHPDMVKLLLSHGADVNTRARVNDWPAQVTNEPRAQYRPSGGLTPLLYAARSGCISCVEDILDAGADINRPHPDGVTPLMVAIDNSHFDLAAMLLERGANPHLWDWWGRTALYVATDNQSSRRPTGTIFAIAEELGTGEDTQTHTALDIMEKLLEMGVNVDARLNFHRPGRGGGSGRFTDDLLTTGATPLLRAGVGQNAEAAALLLKHGAQVDLPNIMGITPFMAAAGQGISERDRSGGYRSPNVQERAIDTLKVLLEAGADINKEITDVSSLTARIARRSTVTDRLGQTALYGAIKWAWADVVEFLVEHGAEINMEDAIGKTPVDAAMGDVGGRDNEPSEEIEQYLRAKGGKEGTAPPAQPIT